MVGNCANRQCRVPFRYFREGRLFAFDLSDTHLLGDEGNTANPRNVEHFWLCGRCASTLTLTRERGGGVVARPFSPNRASWAISVVSDGESQTKA